MAGAAVLSHKQGLYPGDYLRQWLSPILDGELGVRSFGDLKLTTGEDPGMSLADGHNYRLVVHVSDVTRAELVRLPWDYPFYGYEDHNTQDVIEAVRASMSIPFFFGQFVSTRVLQPSPYHGRMAARPSRATKAGQ